MEMDIYTSKAEYYFKNNILFGRDNIIFKNKFSSLTSESFKIDFTKYDCIVDMCLFSPSQFELIKDKISKDTNYIFVSSGAADYRYIGEYGDYGMDKLAVEHLLEFSELNYEIVRPSYIVGIGNHRPRLGHYIQKICEEKSIKIDFSSHIFCM